MVVSSVVVSSVVVVVVAYVVVCSEVVATVLSLVSLDFAQALRLSITAPARTKLVIFFMAESPIIK